MKRISESPSTSSLSSPLEDQQKNIKTSSSPQSQFFNSQQQAMSQPSADPMSSYYSQQNQYAQMAMLQYQYQNAYYNQQNLYVNQQQQQNPFLYNQAAFATNQYMRMPPPTMQSQSPSLKQQQNQIIFDTSQPPPPCSIPKKIMNQTPPPSVRFPHQGGFDSRQKNFPNQRLRKNVMPPRNSNAAIQNYRLVRSRMNGPENGHNLPEENHITVNKKAKRKPMSTRYSKTKEWNRVDAIKALEMEKECNSSRTPMLILKFPDPELNKHVVRNYSPFIETVHFQQPSTARYCFVQLKADADIDKVKSDLCKISFGTGHVLAERKFQTGDEGQPVAPEEIDPYTLYIGNLPTHISVKAVREHFPKATRIDIGYAQRMKYTRYAFIRYNSVEDSMEAYKRTFNSGISSRSLIVRFRRSKGNIGLPGESRKPNQRREIATTQSHISAPASSIISSAEGIHSEGLIPASPIQLSENPPGNLTQNKIQKDNTYKSSNFIEDSKNYVLDDTNRIPMSISTIKEEPEDPYSVDEENNLLEARIKYEPPDDDELLAQAQHWINIEDDYDFDSDPDFDNENDSSKKTCYPHSNSTSKSLNWEEARQKELNKEENKPEIDSRGNIVSGPFSRMFNTSNSIFSIERKHDDLDDLFESMNREDDDDY